MFTKTNIRDPAMVEKITKSLSLTIPPHILRSKDPRALLLTLFSKWLPLSTALLVSVIEHLPAPPLAQATRLPMLIDSSPGSGSVAPAIRQSVVNFESTANAPVVAYVSKMVSVPISQLPHNRRRGQALTAEEARDMARRKRAEIAKAQAAATSEQPHDEMEAITHALSGNAIGEESEVQVDGEEEKEEPEKLIGFARLYSGVLTVGDSVYVLPPKFSPANPHTSPEPQKVIVTALYLLMGKDLESLNSVPAGVVFGIGGLEGHIFKSGTLCSQLEGSINLAGVSMGTQPIVRVALEPENPGDLDKMITGLKLLEQSDPCAQYEVLESGEHVILTAGELHLERCLKDLRERFARCEIQAGEPIVPYRETIINSPEMAALKNKDLPRGTVIAQTTSKQINIRLRVRPLPAAVTEFLEKNAPAIRQLYAKKKAEIESSRLDSEAVVDDAPYMEVSEPQEIVTNGLLSLIDFKKNLKTAFAEDESADKSAWTGVIDKITAFGPRRTGPNILVDVTTSAICQKL